MSDRLPSRRSLHAMPWETAWSILSGHARDARYELSALGQHASTCRYLPGVRVKLLRIYSAADELGLYVAQPDSIERRRA
jgi:hypothetical protein